MSRICIQGWLCCRDSNKMIGAIKLKRLSYHSLLFTLSLFRQTTCLCETSERCSHNGLHTAHIFMQNTIDHRTDGRVQSVAPLLCPHQYSVSDVRHKGRLITAAVVSIAYTRRCRCRLSYVPLSLSAVCRRARAGKPFHQTGKRSAAAALVALLCLCRVDRVHANTDTRFDVCYHDPSD